MSEMAVPLPEEEEPEEESLIARRAAKPGAARRGSTGGPVILEEETWTYMMMFPRGTNAIPVSIASKCNASNDNYAALAGLHPLVDTSLLEMSAFLGTGDFGDVASVPVYAASTTTPQSMSVTQTTNFIVHNGPIGRVVFDGLLVQTFDNDFVPINPGLRETGENIVQRVAFSETYDWPPDPQTGLPTSTRHVYRVGFEPYEGQSHHQDLQLTWTFYSNGGSNPGNVTTQTQTKYTTTSGGHYTEWITPWIDPTNSIANDATALWYMRVEPSNGQNKWFMPIFLLIKPYLRIPVKVVQFPGNTLTNQEWDDSIARVNEIYTGTNIRFYLAGGIDTEATPTDPGIWRYVDWWATNILKISAEGILVSDWSTTYPDSDPMTAAYAYNEASSTEWWLGIHQGLTDRFGLSSLRALVNTSLVAQGNLSSVTVYSGVRCWDDSFFSGLEVSSMALGRDENLAVQGNTAESPPGAVIPYVAMYEIFDQWANTIVIGNDSDTITDARSELAQMIGEVLGLYSYNLNAPHAPPGTELMDPNRDNQSECRLLASLHLAQAYKVARNIKPGQR